MKTLRGGARTLERGLAILDILAQTQRPMGVTELAERLDLDKSTVHRLLTTLVRGGYARQESHTRNYALGAQVLVLYDAFQEYLDLRKICRPLLREMTDITKETSHLAVLSGANIVFVDWISTPQVMGVRTVVGRSEPAWCTALGKAILAALPDDDRDAALRGTDFKAYTDRTPVTLDAMGAELEVSANRGWALDNEEFLLGVRCIASAVLDRAGYPVAALGISAPAIRLNIARCRKLGPQINELARRASVLLGYSG